ncbi:GNAT family N-acetyltransferase [Microbacterium sp. NPDC058389]|uniref:GNAT family N-acetyltransferase n=1 Tax=Microbacterium sp. NPDC058389 TaxID=3346475 RepID=UPI003653806E
MRPESERADSAGSTVRTVSVRTARADEFDRVGEVTYLGFGHGEPGAIQPDTARLALLRDAASRAHSGELLVAVDETDRIMGTASLLRADSALVRQSRGGEAELRLLAVLPEARRRGIGEALMREAIARGRAWGAPALVLDTGPTNERSQRLYARLGFERLPERETVPASRGGFLAVFRYAYDD